MPEGRDPGGAERSRQYPRGGYRQGNRPPEVHERSLLELWPNYLTKGYFDEHGHLIEQFVARASVEPLIQTMARSASPLLTTHQVRRFFQHCRAIEARLRARRSTWEDELASFRKLDVAVADAIGKRPPKIPNLFHEFIRLNVRAVHSERDFLEGFLPHFEALVGFGARHLTDDRGRT